MSMSSCKVSVCVPVYKAEKYLRRCLDSLLAQTLLDMEVLLVDDGSPDRSGEICDEYAKKDYRFRVFHQENRGAAVARQIGHDHATGEFVIHLDADDWVEPDIYEKMYNKAKETGADMVICDFIVEYGNRSVHQRQHPNGIHTDDPLDHLLRYGMNSAMWNKMINRKLLCGSVKFVPGMPTSEDFYVLCQLFVSGLNRVAFVTDPLYHYDRHSNPVSLSQILTPGHIYAQKFCIDYLEKQIDTQHYKEGLITRKRVLKRLIWDLPSSTKRQLVSTYPEVNKTFLNEGKIRIGLRAPISYALNGHYLIGVLLRPIYPRVISIMAWLQRLLK